MKKIKISLQIAANALRLPLCAAGAAAALLAGTSGSTLAATPNQAPATNLGWWHIDLSGKARLTVMIRSIKLEPSGRLQVTGSYPYVQDHRIYSAFLAATVDPETDQVSALQPTTAPAASVPAGTFLWSSRNDFFKATTTGPTAIALTASRKRLIWPSKIPLYQSELNPPSKPGAAWDNAILGQDGEWVYAALKGPAGSSPPLTWHFRYWNRLVALNVVTDAYHIYPIPRMSSTNLIRTWSEPPCFTAAGNKIYIGVGNWIAILPSTPPPSSAAITVRHPIPHSILLHRAASMLSDLTRLQTKAATGLASYWNCHVMQERLASMCPHPSHFALPWVMQPIIFNHGDQPDAIDWAVDMPLASASGQAKERSSLLTSLMAMEHSPINTAWIVYDTPKSMRTHFHRTLPTALPGYYRKDGLYWPKALSQ